MIAWILAGLGLVFFLEGLAYALAPSLVERLLEMLRALPIPARRNLGLGAMAAGVALLWLANALGL